MPPIPSTASPQHPVLTRDIARAVGVPIQKVYSLVREGRVAEPARDSSGRYIWSASDIEAVRVALRTDRRRREHRQRKEVADGPA